jgi:hypothetical protein
MPNGLTLEVLLAVRDFFRGTTDAATRETILRDLHNVKDEAALPEVRRLFIEGLRDPDEKVRDRAARDADTYASDPEVRLALEHARDSDESKGVRKKAAATLDAKPR